MNWTKEQQADFEEWFVLQKEHTFPKVITPEDFYAMPFPFQKGVYEEYLRSKKGRHSVEVRQTILSGEFTIIAEFENLNSIIKFGDTEEKAFESMFEQAIR